MIKKSLFLIILFTLLCSSYAYGKNPPIYLDVGVDPTLPPFQFIENGKITGLNIELLNLIAKKNNIILNYIPLNKMIGIEKLINDELDLVLGVRYDPKLSDKIYYTEGIVQSVVCLLAKSGNSKEIQDNLNKSNYLASVEYNSAELSFLENIRSINFNVAFNQEDAFELLLLNRADFLLGVKDTAEYLLSKYKLNKEYTVIDSYTTPVEYSIAIKIENRNLASLLDRGISQIKLSGEYEDLYTKWVVNSPANITKRLERIITISVMGLSITIIIFLLGIIWSLQLKKQVKLKTKELSKMNEDLEAQIIETRNNIELKHLICESSPRGIATFDLDGTITTFNSSALAIASLDESPIGKSIFDIEPINLMIDKGIDNIFKKIQSYTCDEFEYFRDNKKYIFRYVMYPLLDYMKKLKGGIITIEDITEECKIREEIAERDKNKVLTQIISGISHEIRNPMTTIKTFIELLPKKIDNPRFREEIVKVVPEEIERVDSLIGNLIDYARPKSQDKKHISLNEIVSSCLGLFMPVFEQYNIRVVKDMDGDLFIYGDKNQIKQSIINFILNSIDAIKERQNALKGEDYIGKIIIIGHKEKTGAYLSIIDNGIGMTKEEIRNSLEVFYTTKEKGTGLGLPVSIQLLKSNNCNVIFDSVKGKYTKINLFFRGDQSEEEHINN